MASDASGCETEVGGDDGGSGGGVVEGVVAVVGSDVASTDNEEAVIGGVIKRFGSAVMVPGGGPPLVGCNSWCVLTGCFSGGRCCGRIGDELVEDPREVSFGFRSVGGAPVFGPRAGVLLLNVILLLLCRIKGKWRLDLEQYNL